MNKILPNILSFLTGHTRQKVTNVKWSKSFVTYNLFRLYELLFWRRVGNSNMPGDTIRAESSMGFTGNEKNGLLINHTFYTWESMAVYSEFLVHVYCKRTYAKLKNKLSKWNWNIDRLIPQIGSIFTAFQPQFSFVGFSITPANGTLPKGYSFAIAVGSSTQDDFGFSNTGSLTYSYTVSGSDNMLFLSFFTDSTTSTATYNGTSLTSIGHGTTGSPFESWGMFLLGPSSGAHNLVLSNVGSYCHGGLTCYSGVLQSSQPDASNTASASNNNTITGTVTVVTSNCWLIAACSDREGTLSSSSTFRYKNGNFSIVDSNGVVSTGSQSITVTSSHAASGENMGMAIASFKPIGSTDSTITAAYGSFSLTGNAMIPRVARTLAFSYGSFTLTMQTVVARYGRKITAAYGSFVLTGNDVMYRLGKGIQAAYGSFTLTGQNVAFKLKTSIVAQTGYFVLTGIAANLNAAIRYTWTLTASTGSFVLTGFQALFRIKGWLLETKKTPDMHMETKKTNTWQFEDKN